MATSVRRVGSTLVAALMLALALVGVQASTSSAASAEGTQAYTICYDASQAGYYVNTAHNAGSIWNSRVSNIYWYPCGGSVRIYMVYGGGSRAYVYGLGNGVIYIDYYQAQQYSPLRIMTHEMGHILGLPDNYNGNCAILMSGGSAGTGCTNPYPSSGEAYQVYRNFGGVGTEADEYKVYKDSWPIAA
ncbi:MAG TPA: snapalysin family zinc-dependent metalloprotease [Micromonosporaceae bacterium]|nr:snapalysin family zinc-dependent metalloprotease [Micromonosporaceae bacterium]